MYRYVAINEASNPHDCLINKQFSASFPSHYVSPEAVVSIVWWWYGAIIKYMAAPLKNFVSFLLDFCFLVLYAISCAGRQSVDMLLVDNIYVAR